MTTAILDKSTIKKSTIIKKTMTKTLPTKDTINRTHHFVIKVVIDNEQMNSFLDYLHTFDFMRKAKLSAFPEGVCIKLETSNKNLCALVLGGIHDYVDVKRIHIVAS